MAKRKSSVQLLAESIVAEYKTKEALFGEKGFVKDLQKRLYEAALNGELTDHLGYDKHAKDPAQTNARNGYTPKIVQGAHGAVEIEVPRDREASFEPHLIAKRQRRFDGFDDKIISLYARGLSTQDIQAQLEDLYGVDMSSSLISTVTDSVHDEVRAWQSRPLDRVYPIAYLDCIVVKVRQDRRIINKAVYLALGVNLEGQKELLGMWISDNEGAKFWLSVLTELKNRGLQDIFIACVDGLTGFPEAIEVAYPQTKVQLCIVHMVRNALKYVSWKDRKVLAGDLRKIYTSSTADEAELALKSFGEKWDQQYPTIRQSWENHWAHIIPFFDYPADIRKAIYTTNAIESMNMTLRKVIKNKRVFPNDEAVYKILYLAINNIAKKWNMPIHNWKPAMNRFIIDFGDRVPV